MANKDVFNELEYYGKVFLNAANKISSGAIKSYRNLVEVDSSFQEGFNKQKGLNAYAKSDFSAAVRDLEPVVSEDEKDAEVFYKLGVSYAKISRDEDAIKVLEQGLALDEKHEQINFRLGIIFLGLENYKKSRWIL